MFYSTAEDNHGLKFNPFKALIVPRPIGWIASVSKSGVPNLAPYSFFNAMSDTPPVVCFASGGHKDSLDNIEATGFVEHLKLPHYVDFQSELENLRTIRRATEAELREAAE